MIQISKCTCIIHVVIVSTGSTDDGGFDDLSFKWELVGGPLQALKEDEHNWGTPLLKLTSPVVGTYQFKYVTKNSYNALKY